MKYKKVTILTLCGVLSACSSTTNELPKNNNLFRTKMVYGKLVKSKNGKYHFSKFSFSKNHSGPWVNLATLRPVFDTSSEDCNTRGLLLDASGTSKLCTDDSFKEEFFYKSTMSVGDVAQSTVGNAILVGITFGLGALVAPAYYTVKFDEDQYNTAINEALSTTYLEKLSSDIDSYISFRKQQELHLKEFYKGIKDKLLSSTKFDFTDASGLYEGTLNKERVGILNDNDSTIKLPTSFTDVNSLYKEALDTISERESNAKFQVICSSSGLLPWNVNIKGCGRNLTASSKNIQVKYTVKSKKQFKVNYFPSLSDKNVEMHSVDNEIQIENKTNSFISPKVLSIYVSDRIESITLPQTDIPPLSVKTIKSTSIFRDSINRMTLRNVTKSDINKKMGVGAALKYVIVDRNNEKTLFQHTNIIPSNYH